MARHPLARGDRVRTADREWHIKILDDAPADAGAHEFVVELAMDDSDGGLLRELWESAPDKGDYGVPYALVRSDGGRIDARALRASLQRFNEPADDGWRWTAEALAAHLLYDLCGIALVSWRYPPNRGLCPHGEAYSNEGGRVGWLDRACPRCLAAVRPVDEHACCQDVGGG